MHAQDALNRLWNRVSLIWPLLALAAVTGAAIWFIFGWFLREFPAPAPGSPQQVEYMKEYVGLIQVLAVGVVVTLASAIIPIILSVGRDRFERYKESRGAYSRAKTAVLYLPDKVLASKDRKSALQLVEAAHRELHFAETFQQDMIEKRYLDWFGNPRLWTLYNYWQISAVATVVRQGDWSSPETRERLRDQLHKSLELVHRRFGRRGENCIRQRWDIKRKEAKPRRLSRFTEEDALEKQIEDSIRSQADVGPTK